MGEAEADTLTLTRRGTGVPDALNPPPLLLPPLPLPLPLPPPLPLPLPLPPPLLLLLPLSVATGVGAKGLGVAEVDGTASADVEGARDPEAWIEGVLDLLAEMDFDGDGDAVKDRLGVTPPAAYVSTRLGRKRGFAVLPS